MSLRISAAGGSDEEVAALIETLHETSRRLEELTAGEVDSVLSVDGRMFLLQDAQDHLRYSEAAKQAALISELRALFDLVPAMIWFKDTGNRILRVNKRVADAVGKSVGEIEGKTTAQIYPKHAAKYYADDLNVIHSGVPKLGIVEPLQGDDGKEYWVQTDKVPVCDQDGNVTGIFVMAQDITERLKIESNLRTSEHRFRSLFSAISEGVFVIDAKTGTFLEANEPGATMYGYTPSEMIGRDIEFISSNVAPYTQSDAVLWIERAASTGETQTFDWHAKARDGRLFWSEVSIRLAQISGRVVVLSIVRNVSQQRATEAQSLQAQKMEAIGTLAGGVAHELNNLLQPIIMMTEIVLTELPDGDPHARHLGRVIDAGGKAAEIVQRILAFGRTDEATRDTLDIGSVVRGAIGLVRTVLPSSITLHTEISDYVGTVCGDRTQLTQVLVNLATNARDAIDAKVGTVCISLSRLGATDARPPALAGTVHAGPYAVLTVDDSGSGMEEATRVRMFEPFFTTKVVGKGTGLGLSITHGIVTGHGGAIQVESTVGIGTKFSIYLPIS